MTLPNYFESTLSTERYAAARPPVHETALSRFVAFAGIDLPVGEALDVGCGTGQSTQAVARIARHTLGIDPSESMLAVCEPHSAVDFKCCAAESLPSADETCDLMVVAQAFHWFDQEAFLSEAHRVLASTGWLLIYNAWFKSRESSTGA